MIGIPAPSASYALPLAIGNMLFVPCPIDPFNPALFTLADNFPIGGCPPLLPSAAAPWSLTVPGGVPVPDRRDPPGRDRGRHDAFDLRRHERRDPAGEVARSAVRVEPKARPPAWAAGGPQPAATQVGVGARPRAKRAAPGPCIPDPVRIGLGLGCLSKAPCPNPPRSNPKSSSASQPGCRPSRRASSTTSTPPRTSSSRRFSGP